MVWLLSALLLGILGRYVPVLYAPEEQVVHHMTLVQSLTLEAGQRPEPGTWRESAVRLCVLEAGMRGEHVEHPLGVWLPVGRAVDDGTGLEAGRGEVEELRLDQPPLVVPL